MAIVVFLIDTSASMNTRCYLGTRLSLLDLAKEAVETFIKVRQRSPESRGDRYMLLSFEDPPLNIKVGWRENLETFIYELRNLKSYTLTTVANALKNTFDLLNVNRMQSGIDTYGQGRCPFYLEPSVIILVTDGGKLNTLPDPRVSPHPHANDMQPVTVDALPTVQKCKESVKYPTGYLIPGYELTTEPYRWDQRLYSLVLRLPGTPAMEHHFGLVPSDISPIDNVCEATGGRSYCVTSYRILMQCVDSLVQKVQNGVVISFEKYGIDPSQTEAKPESTIGHEKCKKSPTPAIPKLIQDPLIQKGVRTPMAGWQKCRRQIYVDRSGQKGVPSGCWPIPESYWPDTSKGVLPPRAAHPKVIFLCTNQEPMLLEGLPVDKYELEPSPLTQFILAKKQPMMCWQVFVANSCKKSTIGYPFGYLKANLNLTHVCLFVMPYNYPVLLPLLDELFKTIKPDKSTVSTVCLRPALPQQQNVAHYRLSYEWRTQFSNYLRTIPPYYYSPLKRVFRQRGYAENFVQALIPDSIEIYLSFPVVNYLNNIKKEAKTELERICHVVQNKAPVNRPIIECPNVLIYQNVSSRKETVSHPLLKHVFKNDWEQQDFSGFRVGIQESGRKRPFSSYVPRDQLYNQYLVLRDKVIHPTHPPREDDEEQHNRPVSQMGNYLEYLKSAPMPLREIESTSMRDHMFGNPFIIDKNMMVDEADVDPATGTSPVQGTKHASPREPFPGRPRKRQHAQISNAGPAIQE